MSNLLVAVCFLLAVPSEASERHVFLRLAQPPLSLQYVSNHRDMSSAEQADYVAELRAAQVPLLEALSARHIPVSWQFTKVLNGVHVVTSIDDSALLGLPGVVEVHPIIPMRPLLDMSVPHIGASAIHQELAFDGTGVHVGVIDSGIDYFHDSFGGGGNPDHYAVNDDLHIDDGVDGVPFFPTAKVVGGYDFVGSDYKGGGIKSPKPDLDPMPDHKVVEKKGKKTQEFANHGTHVAGIVAGLGGIKASPGVAPGASLWALKVFSTGYTNMATAAIEWALDPNQDDDLSDALDVLNLSLGGSFSGGNEASTAASQLAIQNFVAAGGIVVAAAGNSGDHPMSLATPSAIPEAISVAATHAPGEFGTWLQIHSPKSIKGYYGIRPGHGKLVKSIGKSGPMTAYLKYVGHGCDAESLPAVKGMIVVVDRGECNFDQKFPVFAAGGALAAIVVNHEGNDTFQMKGETKGSKISGVMIGKDAGEKLKKALEDGKVYGTLSNKIPRPDLIDSVWGGSSRGPAFPIVDGAPKVIAKPDISAPGANINSVKAGIGNNTQNSTGTSMAAPHVAGIMAILRQAHPEWTPLELKALLMNTASLGPYHGGNPGYGGSGYRAPHSRAGAGTVGLGRALSTQVVAYSKPGVTIDFGGHVVSEPLALTRMVHVVNKGTVDRQYVAQFDFNDPNKEGKGVLVGLPDAPIVVPAGESVAFEVTVDIDPTLLTPWDMQQTSPAELKSDRGHLLTLAEYGGAITLLPASGSEFLKVPLYVLAKPAGQIEVPEHCLGRAPSEMALVNQTLTVGRAEFFSLVATDANEDKSSDIADISALGVRSAVVKDKDVIQFAISTYGERIHPNDAFFAIYLDVDGDNHSDFILAALDERLVKGELQRSGRIVSVLLTKKDVNENGKADALTPVGSFDSVESTWAMTDLFSKNIILTVSKEALGLADIADPTLNFWVTSFDWNTGAGGVLNADDVVPDDVTAWKLSHFTNPLTLTAGCGEWKVSPQAVDVKPDAVVAIEPPTCTNTPSDILILTNGDSEAAQHLVVPTLAASDVPCPVSLTAHVPGDACRAPVDYAAELMPSGCHEQVTVTGPNGVGLGTHDVSLTIDPGWGEKDICQTQITVIDNQPPALKCPEADVIEWTGIQQVVELSYGDACDTQLHLLYARCESADGAYRTCKMSVLEKELMLDVVTDSATRLVYRVRVTDQSGNTSEQECAAVIEHKAAERSERSDQPRPSDGVHLSAADDSGSGCSSAGSPVSPFVHWWLMAVLVGGIAIRRRRVAIHKFKAC